MRKEKLIQFKYSKCLGPIITERMRIRTTQAKIVVKKTTKKMQFLTLSNTGTKRNKTENDYTRLNSVLERIISYKRKC